MTTSRYHKNWFLIFNVVLRNWFCCKCVCGEKTEWIHQITELRKETRQWKKQQIFVDIMWVSPFEFGTTKQKPKARQQHKICWMKSHAVKETHTEIHNFQRRLKTRTLYIFNPQNHKDNHSQIICDRLA